MALDSVRLGELLARIGDGKIQLPVFQRDWKWDDDRIRAILATVALDFPLGVVMTLECGGEVQFKARPLAGTPAQPSAEPEQLLLDGQQRLTSLYRALYSDTPVDTMDSRNKPLRRWYYIDIQAAAEDGADLEESIWSVPEDKAVRDDFGRRVALDLTTRESECAAGMFPLNLAFDVTKTNGWMFQYTGGSEQRQALWTRFQEQVLNRITQFQVPMIKLPKETSKVAVCTVFEKVNTGGVILNVFELLTATYAGDREYSAAHEGNDFNLRDDWDAIRGKLSAAYPVLEGLESTDFLQAIALASSWERRNAVLESRAIGPVPAVGCKRKDLLNLPLASYEAWSPRIAAALEWVGGFLGRQRIFQKMDLPYRTQLVPLAAIRAALGAETDQPEVEAKLQRWYWCGVLGEMYSGSIETRFTRDVEEVLDWVHGRLTDRTLPDTVDRADFGEQRLTSMVSRNSAAYKGIYALLIKQGAVDWYFSSAPIDQELVEGQNIDIRTIFPKGWKSPVPVENLDSKLSSIVNKTALSHRASTSQGKRAPGAYLELMAREYGQPDDWFDDIVGTHLVSPKLLRANDFDAFYADRVDRLLKLVGEAMGRPVTRTSHGDDLEG
ncbi:DUF262 domain-containing protein [Actinospica robiniae]|uniref:DUF262 domain-containing protein n=1 Tax=Actinospica robiniae TaxID=304901 RepID=UPI0004185CC9|nr:DUF262 domain-containing protein [Actinospica robiniae]